MSDLVLQIGDRKLELELPPELVQEQRLLAEHENMLRAQIQWASYDSLLSAPEIELMRQISGKASALRLEMFRQNSQRYAAVLIKILCQVSTQSVQQYALTLIDDLLLADESVSAAFLALRQLSPELPLGQLLRNVHPMSSEKDMYATFKYFRVISVLLVHDPSPHEEEVRYMAQRLTAQIQHMDRMVINIGVLALMVLLRRDAFRVMFARQEGVASLVRGLGVSGISSQAVYQIVYCIWLASFNAEVAASLSDLHDQELVPRLIEILKNSPKEKVQRIILNTLRNLADKGRNNEAMIDAGAVRVINGLAGKRWGDEDIVETIEVLRDVLQKNLVVMSSFDVYKKEVMSGHLQWSPVHKSERFWRENVTRFEEQDQLVLRALLALLRSSNPTTVSIACHDVGEFVRFHPRGKQLITDLDAKVTLMTLMASASPEVQKEALLATQKLLVANYTFLSGAAADTKQKGKASA